MESPYLYLPQTASFLVLPRGDLQAETDGRFSLMPEKCSRPCPCPRRRLLGFHPYPSLDVTVFADPWLLRIYFGPCTHPECFIEPVEGALVEELAGPDLAVIPRPFGVHEVDQLPWAH